MTDQTQAATPGTFVCPEKGCRALIPDTLEDKREHRRGHEHAAKVEDAMRRSLRELRADFGTLKGSVRDDLKGIREEVSGIDRAVGSIEIPEPVAPLTITRGGWDDDDEPDSAPIEEDDDDDWGFRPATEPAPAADDATAGEPAESAADADPLDPDFTDADGSVKTSMFGAISRGF